MPHSGFGCHTKLRPLKKMFPTPLIFSDTPNFFYYMIFWDPPWWTFRVRSRPFSGRVSRFAEFFQIVLLKFPWLTRPSWLWKHVSSSHHALQDSRPDKLAQNSSMPWSRVLLPWSISTLNYCTTSYLYPPFKNTNDCLSGKFSNWCVALSYFSNKYHPPILQKYSSVFSYLHW